MFPILWPSLQPLYNICFFSVSVADTLHQLPTLYKSIIMSNFSTLDISVLGGYAVSYDEEAQTIFYYHTEDMPSLEVLQLIRRYYPETAIIFTRSTLEAKKYLGICEAYFDVLAISDEPMQLNLDWLEANRWCILRWSGKSRETIISDGSFQIWIRYILTLTSGIRSDGVNIG